MPADPVELAGGAAGGSSGFVPAAGLAPGPVGAASTGSGSAHVFSVSNGTVFTTGSLLPLSTGFCGGALGCPLMKGLCQAFAQIVDAKSPFTYNHSNGVANTAVAIAKKLGFDSARVLFIRHAALLHDLGKMAVSNAILEKPGKPDEAEWQALKAHPAHTGNILRCISGFEQLSEVAASHHEKLDGTGYHRGLTAARLPVEARILVVAYIFDALSAKRPYRDALPLEKVLAIMQKDAPHALDATCLEALEQSGVGCDQSFVDLRTLQQTLEHEDYGSRAAMLQAA